MSDPPAAADLPVDAVLITPAPVPTWRRVLRWLYLTGVLVAFVAAVVARRADLVDQLSGLEAGPLLLSVLCGVGGVGVSGLVWRRMLHGFGSTLSLGVATKVFFVAQLGKYLPGSLWPVLAQAELGRDHGVPVRTALAAQTLFMWVHLVTGAILGVPVIAALGLLPRWTAVLPLALVPLLLPRPLTAMMDMVLRRMGRRPLPGRPSGRDMAGACAWALVMWVLYGLHVHYAVEALEFTVPLEAVAAIGIFAAAWSAGFVVLIAPAGAGARELVLIAGLSAIAAPGTAFTVTLLSRLVLSLADGLWGGIGVLGGVGRRGVGRRGAPPPPSRIS